MRTVWQSVKKIVADDSMSIALFTLFLICIVAQALSGWFSYNDTLRAGHFRPIPFGAYLGTGTFLDGIFSNWQAALLQLAVLIGFSSVLRQKGAAHSRKTPNHRTLAWKFEARENLWQWLYANSLSLAFFFCSQRRSRCIFGSENGSSTRIRRCAIWPRRH